MTDSNSASLDTAYQLLLANGYELRNGGGVMIFKKGSDAPVDISSLPTNLQNAAGIVQNSPADARAPLLTAAATKTSTATTPNTPPADTDNGEIQDADLSAMYAPLEEKFDRLEAQLKATGSAQDLADLRHTRTQLRQSMHQLDGKLRGMSPADRQTALQIMATRIDPLKAATDYRTDFMPKVDAFTAEATGWVRDGFDAVAKETPKVIKGIGDAVSHPQDALQKAGDAAGGFFDGAKKAFSNLNTGKVIGGVGGALAAFLVGSVFGNGPLKWVFTLLLAPFFIMAGAGGIGDGINNWLSGMFGGKKGGDSPQQQQQPGQPYSPQQQQQAGYGGPGGYREVDLRTGAVVPGQAPCFGQELYNAHAFPRREYQYGEVPAGYAPSYSSTFVGVGYNNRNTHINVRWRS